MNGTIKEIHIEVDWQGKPRDWGVIEYQDDGGTVRTIKCINYSGYEVCKLSVGQPVLFDLKESNGKTVPVRVRPTQIPPEPDAKIFLSEWAHIDAGAYDKLSKMALPEKWYYGDTPETYPNGITKLPLLVSYLNNTYKKLCAEEQGYYNRQEKARGTCKKVMLSPPNTDPKSASYAAFNTGLVDNTYQDIYALFAKNHRPGAEPWTLVDFVLASQDKGKLLVQNFNPLPERAVYFKRADEIFLDPKQDIYSDYEHILIENIKRLPLGYLKRCCGDLLHKYVLPKQDLNDPEQYDYSGLGEELKAGPEELKTLVGTFKNAIDLAKKKVSWNYKTAVPMYYPTQDRMSLLLPLALTAGSTADVALVVSVEENGQYMGQTILTLDMAYNNSRLVTRPDSDWLNTETIQNNGSAV